MALYLPMGPEAVFSALACARLGLPHNAIFGGFSSESLLLRIQDSKAKVLITQKVAVRGEKRIDLLEVVKEAVMDEDIEVLVFDKETGENFTDQGVTDENSVIDQGVADQNPVTDKLKFWSELTHSSTWIPSRPVPSEHPLFFLYTSGSTGRPKGLIHSTGGYLLYAAYTLRVAFDIQPGDVFCCTADIGWITGHSYAIYGPLTLGITTVIVEGLPTYPSFYRLFEMVHTHRITQLYTAPTAIRLLKKHFDTTPLDTSPYDLRSLKCLGSVGEPINKEAHHFFSESFGGLHVVDTYWQTETGGFLIAPIYGVKEAKAECAALPMPGIVPIIINDDKNEAGGIIKNEKNVLGKIYITRSWPGIARGILNDAKRYKAAYFSTPIYFTGDEGLQDADGDFWIRGRADDVINVSGHRISTAEVESVACTNKNVAEAAVVSVSHEIKGQSMVLFVVLKKSDPLYEDKIKQTVSELIGGFCRPDRIIECPGIPKTATGKIMRRVLRSLLTNGEVGDLSTCINVDAIEKIKQIVVTAEVNE